MAPTDTLDPGSRRKLSTAVAKKRIKTPIHCYLEPELARRLWHERAETGKYPSMTINEAVRRYFDEKDRREDRESA